MIVELKAVEKLAKAHEVQVVNYLTATGLDVGLLINFGGESLEFKRKHRLRKPKAGQDFQDSQNSARLNSHPPIQLIL
jgi:hypothetical protein